MTYNRFVGLGLILFAAVMAAGCGSSVTIDRGHDGAGADGAGAGEGSSSGSSGGPSGSSSGEPSCATGSELSVVAPEEHGAKFVTADETHAYWSTEAAIRRAPIAGGGPVETVAGGQPTPMGLALDAHYVYWVNHDDERLLRAPKTGSGAPQVLADQTGNGGAFANVVLDDQYAYLRGGCGQILRVPKTGGQVELVAEAASCVQSLLLADGWLYFGDDGALRKVPATGGVPTTLAGAEQARVGGWTGASVGMAVGGGAVYWMSADGNGEQADEGRLMRVSIDGGPPQVLADGIAYGEDVALDGQAVYFAEHGRIAKLELGSGAITTVAANEPQYRPVGIALAGDKLIFTNYVTTAPVLSVCQ